MRAKQIGILLLFCFLAGTSARGADSVLPWTEDNYQAALAEARSREVPLFVDIWAPW